MRVVETLSVPGTLPGVHQAVQAFEEFGRVHALRQDAAWRFLLALDEILSNIVRHGLGRREAAIDLTFSADDELIAVEIVDAAEAFDPLLMPAPDTSSPLDQRQPGGLGIALVRQLMDETQYERRNGRNHFVMRWRGHADR
jgi:serine/threonine-protein kinase RsbW